MLLREGTPVDCKLESLGASPIAIDDFLAAMPITGYEQEIDYLPQQGEEMLRQVVTGAVKQRLIVQLGGCETVETGKVLEQGLLQEAIRVGRGSEDLELQDRVVLLVTGLADNSLLGCALGLRRELTEDMLGYLNSGYQEKAWGMVNEQINITGGMIDDLACKLAEEMIRVGAHRFKPEDPTKLFDKYLKRGTLGEHLHLAWIMNEPLKTTEQEYQEKINFIAGCVQEMADSWGEMQRVDRKAGSGQELPDETVAALISSLQTGGEWQGPERRSDGFYCYWKETEKGEWRVSTLGIQERNYLGQKAVSFSFEDEEGNTSELRFTAPGENWLAYEWLRGTEDGFANVELTVGSWNRREKPAYPHYVGGARYVIRD